MSKIIQIRKGEHLPFSFDRGGETIEGWVCTISWKKFPADAAIASRVITPTDCVWSGFLTSTETAGLDTGLYYLTAKLTNAADDEEEQPSVRFGVTEAWA